MIVVCVVVRADVVVRGGRLHAQLLLIRPVLDLLLLLLIVQDFLRLQRSLERINFVFQDRAFIVGIEKLGLRSVIVVFGLACCIALDVLGLEVYLFRDDGFHGAHQKCILLAIFIDRISRRIPISITPKITNKILQPQIPDKHLIIKHNNITSRLILVDIHMHNNTLDNILQIGIRDHIAFLDLIKHYFVEPFD